MKWVLVWWMILPHHSPVIHIEYYQDETACRSAEQSVPPVARHRCSIR
jgi:hypothetical protein